MRVIKMLLHFMQLRAKQTKNENDFSFSFFALRVAVATLRGDDVAMKRNCKAIS